MANLRYIKNRGRWQVRWRATNRQASHNRVFSGSKVFLEKAKAVNFFADIEGQERQWRQGQVPGRTINQVQDDYLRYAQQFTKRTQGHYKSVLNKFIAGLPEDVIWLQQLRPCHIRAYLSQMLDSGIRNRTCNAHLTVIKSFCRYLYETYDIPNPAAKIRMFTEVPPDSRFLTKAEYEKVIEIASPQAKNRLMFLANTGLRASEFANLTADKADEDLKAITIIGKGRKQRTIPLNETARDLWPIEPASRKALWFQCHGLAEKAGIPAFGPHALRHYFATRLLLAGVPILKVSLLLGHGSVKTTQSIYAHILPADLQGSTDVLCEKPDEQTEIETIRFPTENKLTCLIRSGSI